MGKATFCPSTIGAHLGLHQVLPSSYTPRSTLDESPIGAVNLSVDHQREDLATHWADYGLGLPDNVHQ